MKKLIKSIGLVALCLVFLPIYPLEAKDLLKSKTFKTDFISFKLSNQWDCRLDGSEFVCRPKVRVKKTDAIIIIAAKVPGKDDNIKAFYKFLKQPKKISDYKGRPLNSKVSFIKTKNIHTTQWVDSIHLSSELKNFYTRYLATVKNGIAILVTYSVARSRHKLYAAELNKMISSIQVIAKPPQMAGPSNKKVQNKIDKKPAATYSAPEPKTRPQPKSGPKIIINQPKDK